MINRKMKNTITIGNLFSVLVLGYFIWVTLLDRQCGTVFCPYTLLALQADPGPFSHAPRSVIRLLLVFSVTPFKIDQNKKSKPFKD